MKLHQLSVFLENKPGQITNPVVALSEAGINILTVTLADTEQFGILRLIVPDWRAAKEVLEAAGCVVNVTEVVAVELDHQPGSLKTILELIDAAGINIEYMYAFTCSRGRKAVMVMRFDYPDCAIELLEEVGYIVLGDTELEREISR